MNTQRAKEIVESPDTIRVTYNGEPVYIQHVDDKKETARIYPLDNPQDEKEVPIYTLEEGTNKH